MIQITKTTDLLAAKPINEQILQFGRNDVSVELTKYVNKCLSSLGIKKDNHDIQVLIEDIIDVYRWDSIEDIMICLKNGRQGKYGTTYNKLNMPVIREWMSRHLEDKAAARESQWNEAKHNFKTKEDYLKAVKVKLENDKKEKQEKIQKEKASQNFNNEYMKFKEWYSKNKKPEGTIKKNYEQE